MNPCLLSGNHISFLMPEPLPVRNSRRSESLTGSLPVLPCAGEGALCYAVFSFPRPRRLSHCAGRLPVKDGVRGQRQSLYCFACFLKLSCC